MRTIYACQRCSQLPPPPPIFSIGPPPSLLSVDIRCSARSLSSSSPASSSSSSLALSISLGMVVTLLICTSAALLLKNRLIKRRRRYVHGATSDKFNAPNHRHRAHHCAKWSPLLSESGSSDQTLSTPTSDHPGAVIEPLLTNDLPHEYEQIKYDTSLANYCLVYCRQCATYHQTSMRPTHLYELRTMTRPSA